MTLPKPYYEDKWGVLYNADCRDILPLLPKVDLVPTDPPYGIGADKKNAHSSIRDNPKWRDDWDYRQPDAVDLALKAGTFAAIGRSRAGKDLYDALHVWMGKIPGRGLWRKDGVGRGSASPRVP